MWQGVERIVVDCRFDPSVEPALRATLCRQLRAEVERQSGYHATLATRADRDRRAPGFTGKTNQLFVTIDARLSGGRDTARTLLVSARPERAGGRSWEGPWNRPSPVAVAWKDQLPVVGGPIGSFELLFGDRRDHVRPPLRSDRY